MSLINEALKKAQAERPSAARKQSAMQEMAAAPQPRPPKKKRYLFSFIIAVLVVALFSTLISTFLVYQILGEDEAADAITEPVVATSSANPITTGPVLETQSDAGNPAISNNEQTKTGAPEPDPQTIEEASTVEVVAPAVEPEPVSSPPQEAVEVKPEPVSPPSQQAVAEPPRQVIEKPEQKIADRQTNPQVWNRLNDFEIRGIMSGGSKVLIYDMSTNKARAYTPGDLVDGALSLRISSIENNVILFQTNDGSIFPKSF